MQQLLYSKSSVPLSLLDNVEVTSGLAKCMLPNSAHCPRGRPNRQGCTVPTPLMMHARPGVVVDVPPIQLVPTPQES